MLLLAWVDAAVTVTGTGVPPLRATWNTMSAVGRGSAAASTRPPMDGGDVKLGSATVSTTVSVWKPSWAVAGLVLAAVSASRVTPALPTSSTRPLLACACTWLPRPAVTSAAFRSAARSATVRLVAVLAAGTVTATGAPPLTPRLKLASAVSRP